MFEIIYSARFVKDMKRIKRRNLPKEELFAVVDLIAAGKPLPVKYRDHSLQGDWEGYRECHIRPDWLLVYRIDHNVLTLVLVRTGTHADLF